MHSSCLTLISDLIDAALSRICKTVILALADNGADAKDRNRS